MATPNTISIEKLARLIGTAACPVLVDVRTPRDFMEEPRLIPGSRPRQWDAVADWGTTLGGRPVVVICQQGHKLSHGVPAWLRTSGIAAEVHHDRRRMQRLASHTSGTAPVLPVQQSLLRGNPGRSATSRRSLRLKSRTAQGRTTSSRDPALHRTSLVRWQDASIL